MAKILGANFGGASGRVGKYVFYRSNGQDCVRSMPAGYADKNSDEQQNTRFAKFLPAVEYTRQLKSYAKSIYQTKPAGRSAYSSMQSAISAAFGGTVAVPTTDLTLAIVGNGDLIRPVVSSMAKDSTNAVIIAWDDSLLSPFDKATDVISFFVTDKVSKVVVKCSDTFTRTSGGGVLHVPASFSGNVVEVSQPVVVSADGLLKSSFAMKDALGEVNLD